ncbi:hypothetical protein LA6_003946 [Marinibacterium anthonyi]|nr:hypothetical protein LA6_003946 [Marinibacterium anthonyi]
MAIDPKDSESDAPKVGILARAVPSGHGAPACHGGRAMLKLTLALRPVRSPQATLALHAWPSEIDRLFFDAHSAPALQVQPIALVDGPVPKPDPLQTTPVHVPLLRWTADRGDANRAATLWNRLIPETESWQQVYSSLDEMYAPSTPHRV